MNDADESSPDTGPTPNASPTSAPSEPEPSPLLTSCAAGSLARISRSRARTEGSRANARDSGTSTSESSPKSARASSSSKTFLDSFGGAWTRFSRGSGHLVTRWRGPACAPQTLALLIGESVSSSLPTPTASSYGSSQNGVNRTRPSAGTLSLWTRAARGAWPDGCTDRGLLSPVYVEWLMAFPSGWSACEPLVTPSCQLALPSLELG